MREIIRTDRAPKAIGPYSQGVRAGELVFTAGQIPIDPATGKLVEGGIREQTARVLENLRGVLEAGGTGLDRVVKSTVFLTDLRHFAEFNQVYGAAFPSDPPARTTVQVAALPLGALLEIEMVAVR